MIAKREILEQFAEKGHCAGIPCSECSYAKICGVDNKAMVKIRLQKIGAMTILRMFPEKREFDPDKILTCVTADKAKVGMHGYFADNLVGLEACFEEKDIRTLTEIKDESYGIRFREKIDSWALFYPLDEVEE